MVFIVTKEIKAEKSGCLLIKKLQINYLLNFIIITEEFTV